MQVGVRKHVMYLRLALLPSRPVNVKAPGRNAVVEKPNTTWQAQELSAPTETQTPDDQSICRDYVSLKKLRVPSVHRGT